MRHWRVGARCLWGGDEALELSSHARGVAMVMVGPYSAKKAATARLSSPSAHGCGATYQLQPPASCQRRVARATLARRYSLCLGRRRSTRPCCARAVLRWSQSSHSLIKALCQREASLLRCAAVVRRARCGLQRQASVVSRSAGAPALAVSWEKRGSTRACFARATCGDSCGRLKPRRSAPHRREDSLHRRSSVV